MSEHPIEGLMLTAMNSIKDMIDVDTIIGDPIQASNNIVIIPISKVSFGFVSGGSEFNGETIDEYTKKDKDEEIQYKLPFGGGSGAGVTLNPVAFLVVTKDNVKLLPVDHSSAMDRLLDYIPDLLDKTNNLLNKKMEDKKEENIKIKQKIENVKKDKKPKKPQNKETTYEFEYDNTEDDIYEDE